MVDDQDPKETIPINTNDINYFEYPSSQNDIIPISQDQPLIQNQENSQISKYQAFYDFIIAELNRRYDLRPRPGPSRPIKLVTFDEPQVKSVETKTQLIQPHNQLQGIRDLKFQSHYLNSLKVQVINNESLNGSNIQVFMQRGISLVYRMKKLKFFLVLVQI